jgi:4-amino-4-deoxy-L-arabinose transferase-like glycosyltransferase
MKRFVSSLTATTDRRIALGLIALCALIYLPLAGNYGMWDPWETHYGEVARQMLERNDFVSQWWPGSPQDRQEFFSKPVLTFWLLAMSMKLFGIEWGAHPDPSQIATSWRTEWACRLPMVALGIVAVWATWEIVRRLAGRRAGLLAALILATSSQWLLITRQVMTDMPFVAPMTIALALAGLGLLLPKEERERELGRRSLRGGDGWETSETGKRRTTWLSWPHDPAFYLFLGLFALTTLPQLVLFSIQLALIFRVGDLNLHLFGIVPMLPYIATFVFGVVWCARARCKRQLYLFSGYVLCALASLAKGPAGIALPAIVLIVYLALAGRWLDVIFELEIPRGIVIFVSTCFPWYHAMLIRHGMAFWNEFIGDNYVHRAGGRHGDRGTFEYYIQYIAYGMFPWSGVVTLSSLMAFRKLRRATPRGALVGFALIWFVVDFTVMSLVATKFHHYILPALPALAILAGIYLDDLLEHASRSDLVALLLVAAPVTFMSGRDLAAFPPRILWLFNYDYVNMPGTGRPWPLVSLYGDRYEYGTQLLVFAALATLATVVLAAVVARRDPTATPASEAVSPVPLPRAAFMALAFAVLVIVGIILGPKAPEGAAPQIGRLDWAYPTLTMLVPFAALALLLRWRGVRMAAAWAMLGLSVIWSGFLIDKVLVELSPHWSQKHVIAAYYAKRSGPSEPLIAWQLYWRGENFYTRNQIYGSPQPSERTVFLGDHNAEKMQEYFKSHAGRRVFFVVERARFETLRGILPQAARPSLTIVDDSNNKLYLASANI